MKTRTIIDQIKSEYVETTPANQPDNRVLEGIIAKISAPKPPAGRPRKRLLKPLLAAALAVVFVTSAAAGAPMILKLLGSEIGFFESDKQTRYSADQELIKSLSSEVGITAEQDGVSLTVDNIAFDGTFLNVFYTLKRDKPLYKTSEREISHWLELDAAGYEEQDKWNAFMTSDGYYVSEMEYKGVRRFVMTGDVPEICAAELRCYANETNFALSVEFTLDTRTDRVEPRALKPAVPALVTQKNMNYIDGLEHDIVIDRVSISPLGNIMVITEKGGSGPLNTELFQNFFITDNLGTCYVQTWIEADYRKEWSEDKTYMIEFYGNVPAEAEYFRLVPYNKEPVSRVLSWHGIKPGEEGFNYDDIDPNELYLESEAKIGELPRTLRQSDYGRVTIESCAVEGDEIIMTYRCEGMVITPSILPTDGNDTLSPDGQLGITVPIFDRNTGVYRQEMMINKPLPGELGGVFLQQYDVELLEEQAVMIPLR